MADARDWTDRHGADLVGRPADRAAEEAEAAGLRVRAAGPGQALTLEYRPDRVTLLTDADGLVTEVRAG